MFTEQDVKQLLQEALKHAQSKPKKGSTIQQINMNRTRYWVEALAKQLKKRYAGDSEIRVVSKTDPSNRKDFGLNELLYDILVCRVGEVESSIHKKKLCFIKEVLWQIESEFAHNTRSTLIDFNKLVLGSGNNKLFIASRVQRAQKIHSLEYYDLHPGTAPAMYMWV